MSAGNPAARASATRLQEDIAALLGAHAPLSQVMIFQEQKGTIEDTINKALAGIGVTSGKKPGLCIMVQMPFRKQREEGAMIVLNEMELQIRVWEKPIFNRTRTGTGITADDAADEISIHLQGRSLGLATLVYKGTLPIRDDEGAVGADVNFTFLRELDSQDRAATPLIDISGTPEATVTLTGSGAEGELIYFTTDSTPPVPGAAAVNSYDVPFTAYSGDTIRASSTADNRVLSSFSEAIIP